jgi:hypothetical protein
MLGMRRVCCIRLQGVGMQEPCSPFLLPTERLGSLRMWNGPTNISFLPFIPPGMATKQHQTIHTWYFRPIGVASFSILGKPVCTAQPVVWVMHCHNDSCFYSIELHRNAWKHPVSSRLFLNLLFPTCLPEQENYVASAKYNGNILHNMQRDCLCQVLKAW